MNTPIGMRCTHVGCDRLGKFCVAVVLFADPDFQKKPLFQKVKLPKHRRCENPLHQPKTIGAFINDDAWPKLARWFQECAKAQGRSAEPVRELSQVVYYESETELDMIEVSAVRDDGALERVGKIKVIG